MLIRAPPMTPESGPFAAGFPLVRGGSQGNTGPERQPVCATGLEPTRTRKHAMKPETIAKARTMLSSVLLDGLSYREAGAPFGVGRSTVERSIKSLVLEVAREHGIPELDEDGLSCLPRLRQFPRRRQLRRKYREWLLR